MKQDNQVRTPGRAPSELADLDYFDAITRAHRARSEAVANAISGGFRAIGILVRRTITRISKRQHTVDELNALDDRMLRDIGITRGDIPFVAARASQQDSMGNDNGARAA